MAHSEETKRKISETRKRIGYKPPSRLGAKHSLESLKKMSEGSKLAWKKNWHPGGMLGKKMSKETRMKMSESHKGSKSYLWKGGITPLVLQIRHCFKTRQWRSDIYTRDNYTCQICFIRGGKLNADHYPKTFSNIFRDNKIKSLEQALICEEFWNINNGRTLCLLCHKKTETWGGETRYKKQL